MPFFVLDFDQLKAALLYKQGRATYEVTDQTGLRFELLLLGNELLVRHGAQYVCHWTMDEIMTDTGFEGRVALVGLVWDPCARPFYMQSITHGFLR